MTPRDTKAEMPRTITATAPCRIDLAGGTLDIWPLYLFHPGAVTVNLAISVRTRCRIITHKSKEIVLRSLDTGRADRFGSLRALAEARSFRHGLAGRLVKFFAPGEGFTLETHSESPAGAGISGSSALMIATTAALARLAQRKLSAEEIRVIAQNVEAQLIEVPTGCQDYYPALFGGANAVHLGPDGIHREPVAVRPADIDGRFVLAYTGAPRKSGINNWEVFKSHMQGDRKVRRNLAGISAIAQAMRKALGRADWDGIAKLMREEWKLRKAMAPGITTPAIERLVAAAARSGAQAAKVCGAGGGGCVVFLIHPAARTKVRATLQALGAQLLDHRLARRGLVVSSE